MIKTLKEWLGWDKKRLQFDKTIHKECDDCGGTGLAMVSGTCINCEGNGFVKKSRKEVFEDNFN